METRRVGLEQAHHRDVESISVGCRNARKGRKGSHPAAAAAAAGSIAAEAGSKTQKML